MMHIEIGQPVAERSLFQAMVTADKPPKFFCGREGISVRLIAWYGENFDSCEQMREHCKPLLDAVPGLTCIEGSKQTVVYTPLLEQTVLVHTLQGLRDAKQKLARQIEQHLGIVTTIQ